MPKVKKTRKVYGLKSALKRLSRRRPKRKGKMV